ncbi:MAG: hypothetical protein PHU25_14290 [Deltaproteobacteria bacterium]|nr:hypothetical protein [Deltaproteobacteria bacterium]
MVTRCFALVAVLVAALNAGSAHAQTLTPSSTPPVGRGLIWVVTDPPGVYATIDDCGQWYATPHSFPAAPGGHLVKAGGSGFKDVELRLVTRSTDVTVRVEMDRPVYEAGIALVAIGAIPAALGLAMLVAAAVTQIVFLAYFGAVILGPSVPVWGTGIGMMVSDGQREPITRVSSGAPE